MIERLEDFLTKNSGLSEKPKSELIDYFVYFLTSMEGLPGARVSDIKQCFLDLNIVPYSNIPQYLSKNSKRSSKSIPKFINKDGRYVLERTRHTALNDEIQGDPLVQQTTTSLRDLMQKISNVQERDFLEDAIICFECRVYRAAIIMVWILAIEHLYTYVFEKKLDDFNAALAKFADKRVKTACVKARDDFSDIPEGKFIEICRGARIISNDVRKILEEMLGTRNSCAHPSGVVIGQATAIAFIESLINNIILKYGQ